MLSWILLILVIAAVFVFGIWLSASLFGRGEVLPPMDEPADVIAANRAAVAEGRFEDITLEVVARGYRQDQVDALVEDFRQFGAGASTIGLVEFVEE
ncbi:cell division protein DivIVA [Corynebacterium meitnerae]|uniref:Cell division protein DivIVA n=1 Tax=Corynebacterium meitnerae TaxID=2913498 RepID=A0A9X3RKG2_9CORY|nr:cell division protein DivIVA [Corynebacterium meitnerae]MCZ9294216.1 cell division protein DivIVA [Corynebacterium meitnerae]